MSPSRTSSSAGRPCSKQGGYSPRSAARRNQSLTQPCMRSAASASEAASLPGSVGDIEKALPTRRPGRSCLHGAEALALRERDDVRGAEQRRAVAHAGRVDALAVAEQREDGRAR